MIINPSSMPGIQHCYAIHYHDVIMTTMASQITSLTIVYWIVYSDADQRIHQNSASLAFVWGIHRGPVNSPHTWPVTRRMFPFDDVIMCRQIADHEHGLVIHIFFFEAFPIRLVKVLTLWSLIKPYDDINENNMCENYPSFQPYILQNTRFGKCEDGHSTASCLRHYTKTILPLLALCGKSPSVTGGTL